ncbi:DUF4389 domain-containing protein [Chloroflexota bacterium]
MAGTSSVYPVQLSIDYPDRALNRLTTFFRIFMVIPIIIVLGLLIGGNGSQGATTGATGACNYGYYGGAAGFVVLPLVLMLLFRQKYPRWWFDWNMALLKFGARVKAYFILLTDEYPSTDEDQAVHIEIAYPDSKNDLNRWLPLVKWLLAIPHYIILYLLYIAVIVSSVIAWFAILFTGRYPRGLFDFVVGVFRWALRVSAYALLLTTDRYPPFGLSE